MADFFVLLLFGHLFGDYIFQNNWMALNKSNRSWAGAWACLVHCLIYTAAVCLFTWEYFSWWWVLLVFLSHYPLDRYSVGELWLTWFKGRSLREYLKNDLLILPPSNYHILQGSFGAVVYTVVDNTFHLSIMFFGYKFLI